MSDVHFQIAHFKAGEMSLAGPVCRLSGMLFPDIIMDAVKQGMVNGAGEYILINIDPPANPHSECVALVPFTLHSDNSITMGLDRVRVRTDVSRWPPRS